MAQQGAARELSGQATSKVPVGSWHQEQDREVRRVFKPNCQFWCSAPQSPLLPHPEAGREGRHHTSALARETLGPLGGKKRSSSPLQGSCPLHGSPESADSCLDHQRWRVTKQEALQVAGLGHKTSLQLPTCDGKSERLPQKLSAQCRVPFPPGSRPPLPHVPRGLRLPAEPISHSPSTTLRVWSPCHGPGTRARLQPCQENRPWGH